jgi:hypothetical protein
LFDINVLIDSRHWQISTSLHFQNGRHNTAKIQHCSISKVAFNLFLRTGQTELVIHVFSM